MDASGSVPQRIGDAERDVAVASLQEHHVAGRLDRSEFDDRMAAALAARTQDDLTPLFADLPQTTATAAVPAPVVVARPAPAPWARYGAPALATAIWPVTIMLGLLTQNWSLIIFAVVITMALGRTAGPGCGGPRTQLQRR